MLKPLNLNDFEKIYEIMKQSFPFDEIRSFEEQKRLLNHKNYSILVFSEQEKILGFVAIWNFDNFVFLEHFAISSNHRNQGLGNIILNEFSEYTDKTIILEVEYPTNNISARRIKFYERNGFKLFDFNYIMPPFTKNHKPIPLLLMSKTNLTQKIFDDFYDKIVNIINNQTQ